MPEIFVDVVVMPDGSISFAVADGENAVDFDSAAAEIKQLVAGLQMEGIEFSELGGIERHRHDTPPSIHAHDHAR